MEVGRIRTGKVCVHVVADLLEDVVHGSTPGCVLDTQSWWHEETVEPVHRSAEA